MSHLDRGARPMGDAMPQGVVTTVERAEAASFRRMFEALYDDVVRFVERRVEPSTVEDVVAETFLVGWRRIADLPTDLADQRPWLFTVARYTIANTRRSGRRSRDLAMRIASQPRQQDDAAAEVAHRVDLARAFKRLRPRDQEALALVAWDGLTPTAAAHVLGISVSAFSVRLTRARQRLRAHLTVGATEGGSS